MKKLIDRLERDRCLLKEEYAALIRNRTDELAAYLFEKAVAVRKRYYGNDIYIRGLIEFTNYCKNDCLYCGIRRSNQKAERYRLSKEQILSCCAQGHALGFRTFVLQGGEDPFYTDEAVVDIIREIKETYPDCALTLSLGEKSHESYAAFFNAGADRYLLRHETADSAHYAKLHSPEMVFLTRIACLEDLKQIGFDVGCGFMVGSPFQTAECLAEDMLLLSALQPEMVGIGPFIPHHDTPFAKEKAGHACLNAVYAGAGQADHADGPYAGHNGPWDH